MTENASPSDLLIAHVLEYLPDFEAWLTGQPLDLPSLTSEEVFGALGLYLEAKAAPSPSAETIEALQFIEDMAEYGNPIVEKLIQVDLLEALSPAPREVLRPQLGPLALTMLQEVDAYWARLAAWLKRRNETPTPSTPVEATEDARLLLALRGSNAGGRGSVADAVRYEDATGDHIGVERETPELP